MGEDALPATTPDVPGNCRVSTADQSCGRQERDLAAFAARAGYEVVGVFKETGSGAKLDRAERKKVMLLLHLPASIAARSSAAIMTWLVIPTLPAMISDSAIPLWLKRLGKYSAVA
jgi:hypothetical protein